MQWELLSHQGPPSRRDALLESNEAENTLVLFGGRGQDGSALGDLWKYFIANNSWVEIGVSGTLPQPRFSFVGGFDKFRNRLVIFGGELAKKKVVNDLWEFDFANNRWIEVPIASRLPEPRYGAAGGIVELTSMSALIVSHGFDKGTRWSNSFSLVLGASQPSWVDITPQQGPLPTARCLVAGAIRKTAASDFALAMYGGCGSGGYGPCPSSEFWNLAITGLGTNAVSAQWNLGPSCVHARTQGAMVSHPQFFALYGGSGGPLVANDEEGQLNLYIDATQSWKQVVPSGPGGFPSQTGYHSGMCLSTNSTLWLLLGGTSQLWRIDISMFQSLLDVDTCHNDPIPAWRIAHGVFMILSWGILLPLGVLIARFGRIHAPLWFKIHRAVQMAGVIFALTGFVISMLMVSEGLFLAYGHSITGLVVTLLGFQQPLNAYFRPHVVKDTPKTRSRLRWEFWHKFLGRLGIVLGMANIFAGLSFLVKPSSAPFVLYSIWFILMSLTFCYLTGRGLPWTANGPSRLAVFVNAKLCCCLKPWGDNFRVRPQQQLSDGEGNLLK